MLLSSEHIELLVNTLVNDSCQVQAGEKIWVESIDVQEDVLIRLLEKIREVGGIPFFQQKSQELMLQTASVYNAEEFQLQAEIELTGMKACQCFIGLRAPRNVYSNHGIPAEQREIMLKNFLQPVHYTHRNQHMRWVYVRIPTESMAQASRLSSRQFIHRYFEAFRLDAKKFRKNSAPLKALLEKGNTIRLLHENGSDLTFRLSGKGTYISAGEKNLPDGEVFTSPELYSAEGTFNTNIPSTYYGTYFHQVSLKFEQGTVVKAEAGKLTDSLNKLLNTDPGARRIGEFAFGLNPFVHTPINDILFDEKMHGSVHIALGNAYPVSDNGNRSSIHWDLILAMTHSYQGGEVWMDDACIMKNGTFIYPELTPLNP